MQISRQEWPPVLKKHRRYRDRDRVQSPRIEELPSQVPAALHPDCALARYRSNLREVIRNGTLDETQVRALGRRKLATREDIGRSTP